MYPSPNSVYPGLLEWWFLPHTGKKYQGRAFPIWLIAFWTQWVKVKRGAIDLGICADKYLTSQLRVAQRDEWEDTLELLEQVSDILPALPYKISLSGFQNSTEKTHCLMTFLTKDWLVSTHMNQGLELLRQAFSKTKDVTFQAGLKTAYSQCNRNNYNQN